MLAVATQTTIIQRARDITGNRIGNTPGDVDVPDEAIILALEPVIVPLGQSFGDSSSRKEVFFNAISGQQDYDIATYVGIDVDVIIDCYRSSANSPDYVLPDTLSPRNLGTGEFYNASHRPVIDAGLQADVFRTIVDLQRADRASRYTAEHEGDKIRLYPPPVSAEVVCVVYTSDTTTITDLPSQCDNALVYCAVVAILNGQLNRIASSKASAGVFGEADVLRMKTLKDQRDYYQTQLDAAIKNLV